MEKLQKSVRYFVANGGKTLYKKDKLGKEIRYESEHPVEVLNDYDYRSNYEYFKHLNIKYYIYQVYKVINQIIPPQLTLWK